MGFSHTRHAFVFFLLVCQWIFLHQCSAQKTLLEDGEEVILNVNAYKRAQRKMPTNLFGVSFEEINHAGHGGIWAELVSNRGFEADPEHNSIDPWVIVGDSDNVVASIDYTSPFPRNKAALKLEVRCDNCEHGVGIYNPGFWGMNIVNEKSYKVTMFVRSNESVPLVVSLRGSSGDEALASKLVHVADAKDWKKIELELIASGTDGNGRLEITTTTKGVIWLDQVSVMPQDTHKRHGYRKDIFDMVHSLRPGFFRFPGGDYVEGSKLLNGFNWKTTIGPWEQRPGHFDGRWGYWVDDGFGFFEYLQLAEDLGALPIWVFRSGISGDGDVPLNFLQTFIDEAMDGIEFAIGHADTTYGSIRAKMGHPKPFHLRYVAVGNNHLGDQKYAKASRKGRQIQPLGLPFWPLGDLQDVHIPIIPPPTHPPFDIFPAFYNAIRHVYPDIKIISNCDGSANALPHTADAYDYHAYLGSPSDMYNLQHLFDKSPRNGPKAFVSEYEVSNNKNGNLMNALAEAAFRMGVERNSDVVEFASYAPLLGNSEALNFKPDAIVFDSSKVYGTPSYWAQHFFKVSNGATYLKTQLYETAATANLTVSAILWHDPHHKQFLRVKAVNFGSNPLTLKIEVKGMQKNKFHIAQSKAKILSSDDPNDENTFENSRNVIPNSFQPHLKHDMRLEIKPLSLTSLDILVNE